MEKIRNTAYVCIGRAVMFGALAIMLVMLSLSFDPALALFAGALLTLVMAQILILKAFFVPWQNPKHTEVWTCLDAQSRPTDTSGLAVFITILRDVYGAFARNSLTVACCFFAMSLALRAVRLVS